jgi:hypothetical protein
MGAYEVGGSTPQLAAPLLTVSGRFTLSGTATQNCNENTLGIRAVRATSQRRQPHLDMGHSAQRDGLQAVPDVGTAPFAWLNTYSGPIATVGVSTQDVTRFYVTSFDATGKYLESKPSNR